MTNIGSYAFWECSSLIKFTSLNPEPPICSSNTFSSVSTGTCTLYIPLGTTKDYSIATGWKDFFDIEEIDTSGIDSVSTDDADVTGYYTIDGKAVDVPQRGINIIRYSDGTTRKILVQ